MPPRGGRGGGGGARRGGASKPGFTRIGGMEVAYDPDIAPERDGRPQPSKTFPEYPHGPPPRARPPSAVEKRQIDLQREVRSIIRRSPLYTTFATDSVPSSSTPYSSRFGPGATTPRIPTQLSGGSKRPRMTSAAASADPFNMMPHYSDRYDQKRRKMPRLDKQLVPVVLEFFPEEIHSVLSPEVAKLTNGAMKKAKRERENLDESEIEAAAADEAEAADASGDENEEGRAKKGRKTKVVAEEGEDVDDVEDAAEDGTAAGEDGEAEEEDVDDNFEDDEDEMAGDYNAEGYFDDGGDDAGDDGMGDGDGGDYD